MRYRRTVLVAALMVGQAAYGSPADKKTQRYWKSQCASCHGADGKAETEQGKTGHVSDMTAKGWQSAHPDDEIVKVIKEGTPKTDKHGDMPAYDLTAEDMGKIVALIRDLAKNVSP